ncbi:BatD family protein [Pseudomonas gingeri]|uniref:Protein BatD n=1 Tax=Pseudomonas gingeri TaxID=117681 RepID=A0A7Y8CN81_9PSED|nr:BatD family protein [Pseudomonas gingeri]NWA03517.1 protein BatD [Pseudomonas gingeri]NWA14375.1 protein BatD [Pseudomonas gingeri]NWA55007.1 protein BatD [Pseudomonas gingeri]NWA94731.1 protein BatD [Pseudomonas gingeri]NWB01387.1 protein BatD [Pseudomonas gingeri]
MTTRFSVFLLWLLCGILPAYADGLVASVDRTRLNSGESVELTLESSDVTQFGKPDLEPLASQFEVRGTRQVNQLTTLGGDKQATTRWIITLTPKQNGSVVIPPLQLGELKSQPITLQVVQSEEQDATNSLAPVYIEASLDQDSVYVQAQAVLTLRIYHSVSLYDDSSLSPLQVTDVRIEQLGESRTYEKLINGVRHGVIELRYALYPQHSGMLTIPAQVFSATLVDVGQNQGQVPAAPKPGKLIHVSSAEMSLDVKPQPSTWPADIPWLPARSLSLSESWSPEPEHSQVGDSLTRSLTLKAEGLSSAQLPPLPATSINGLRRYPDQPQLSNQNSERGLIGSREEREALVPTHSGTFELPTVTVVWWNTHEEHMERSSLPARTLQVTNNPSLAVDTPVSSVPGNIAADAASLWMWKLSTVLLACTTLLGFGLWWRARSQPAVHRAAQTGPSPRTLLDDLKRTCLANDPQATRQALDAWARQQPETLAEMAARFVPLSDALDGLNGALYSETGLHWQGEELWRVIRAIPAAERVQDPVGDSGLPPLYPK